MALNCNIYMVRSGSIAIGNRISKRWRMYTSDGTCNENGCDIAIDYNIYVAGSVVHRLLQCGGYM